MTAEAVAATAIDRWRSGLARACATALPLFTLFEVNYPRLNPHSEVTIFAVLAIAIVFATSAGDVWRRRADFGLALATLAVGAFIVAQTEPRFAATWLDGRALGERAGLEHRADIVVGVLGLLLILEATRRTLGLALPLLAIGFVAYAAIGARLPDWLLPHRGYDVERIVAQTFVHSQGVFGIALRVMFSYVFLFVLLGTLLELTGATSFLLSASRRLLTQASGAAAKVSVLSSGLMGSLSGSAVANTATTGTFTIPLMRRAGFAPHIAAGVEAAASTGGALVPPVMGAGAYMMLEIIDPPVTYLQVIRAALIPACLYYLSLFLVVHFYAQRVDAHGDDDELDPPPLRALEGTVLIVTLVVLLGLLLAGFSVFRAVSVATVAALSLSALSPRTRLGWHGMRELFDRTSRAGVPLVCAAATVGVVIGVVTLTGVGTRLPALILPLAQSNLMLALIALMVSSIVLGVGLPSAVCYLLLATLVGPVLGKLGVVPLAAHLFIFYFGMMSMVTPPVALAAYAASTIAGASFVASSLAAFRFALAGFTLPFLFVFRPELLMLSRDGGPASALSIALATLLAIAGIVPLAAAIAGHLRAPLSYIERALLLTSAALALYPGGEGVYHVSPPNLVGIVLFAAIWLRPRRPRAA